MAQATSALIAQIMHDADAQRLVPPFLQEVLLRKHEAINAARKGAVQGARLIQAAPALCWPAYCMISAHCRFWRRPISSRRLPRTRLSWTK